MEAVFSDRLVFQEYALPIQVGTIKWEVGYFDTITERGGGVSRIPFPPNGLDVCALFASHTD